jgi:hypothetical protein
LGEEVTFTVDADAGVTVLAEVAWVGWAEASAVRLGLRFREQGTEQLAQLLLALGVSSDVGT